MKSLGKRRMLRAGMNAGSACRPRRFQSSPATCHDYARQYVPSPRIATDRGILFPKSWHARALGAAWMSPIAPLCKKKVSTRLLSGCANGTHIITGAKHPAIKPDSVVLYQVLPAKYEIIGIENSRSPGMRQHNMPSVLAPAIPRSLRQTSPSQTTAPSRCSTHSPGRRLPGSGSTVRRTANTCISVGRLPSSTALLAASSSWRSRMV